MKTQHILLLFAGLFLVACNPNKDIYNQLDENKLPYSENRTYALTAADYSSLSKLIKKYATGHQDSVSATDVASSLSFGPRRPFSSFHDAVNEFFAGKFLALSKGSTILAQYDYSSTRTLTTASVPQLSGDTCVYKLTENDYINIGGAVEVNQYVGSNDMGLVITWLANGLYPGAVSGDFCVLTFDYFDGNTVAPRDNFFYFNGTDWQFDTQGHSLTAADYDAMGTGSGQPGSYNNFSSSISPTFFIPIWLKITYPYAKANDSKVITYKYYVNATTLLTYYAQYTYDGSVWKDRITKADQLLHTGVSWAFDPTVYFTMVKADYLIIVNKVKNDPAIANYVNSYGDGEYWYGADSYYPDFNMKLSDRKNHDPNGTLTGKTDPEINVIINDRLKEALIYMLENKFPDAQVTTEGIQNYYVVTYRVYTGANAWYTATFKVIAPGKFEVSEYTNTP